MTDLNNYPEEEPKEDGWYKVMLRDGTLDQACWLRGHWYCFSRWYDIVSWCDLKECK